MIIRFWREDLRQAASISGVVVLNSRKDKYLKDETEEIYAAEGDQLWKLLASCWIYFMVKKGLSQAFDTSARHLGILHCEVRS
ncbi:hypothetical protein Fmac_012292 [Flemingia macrophylla]|uniref:Uncharacterized protein n=1 Tax=Flemingia macrophylla TaxID=520843 RepID=A0ABD1MQ99_9FABA